MMVLQDSEISRLEFCLVGVFSCFSVVHALKELVLSGLSVFTNSTYLERDQKFTRIYFKNHHTSGPSNPFYKVKLNLVDLNL